jgi:hypothetical protein
MVYSKPLKRSWATSQYDEQTLGGAGALLEFSDQSGRHGLQDQCSIEEGNSAGQGFIPFKLLLATGSFETTSSFKSNGDGSTDDDVVDDDFLPDSDDGLCRSSCSNVIRWMRPRIRLWPNKEMEAAESMNNACVALRTRTRKQTTNARFMK